MKKLHFLALTFSLLLMSSLGMGQIQLEIAYNPAPTFHDPSQDLTFNFSVTNTSHRGVQGTFVKVYVSNLPFNQGNPGNPMNPYVYTASFSGYSSQSFTYTVSSTYLSGSWKYIHIQIGSSGAHATAELEYAAPDLVASINSFPSPTDPNDILTFSARISNVGTGAFNGNNATYRAYLSSGPIWPGPYSNSYPLNPTFNVPSLQPGQFVDFNYTIYPGYLGGCDGNYIHVVIDYSDPNQSNNVTGFQTQHVVPAYGDLVATQSTVSHTTVSQGQIIVAQVKTSNTGCVPVLTPSTTKVYYSNNTIFGDGDDIELGSVPVTALNAGEMSQTNLNVQIPSSASYGSRRIFIVADTYDEADEVYESNNHKTIIINVQKPDYKVASMSVTPNAGSPQSNFDVFFTVQNVGGSTNLASAAKVYVSDNQCALINHQLLATQPVSALNSNSSSSFQINATVGNWSAGQKYIVVLVDSENVIAESNENNNSDCAPFTVGFPDYMIELDFSPTGGWCAETFSSALYTINESVTVNITVQNVSQFNYGNSINVNLHHSSNAIWESSDQWIGWFPNIPPLGPQQSYSANLSLSMNGINSALFPQGLSSGSFHIIARMQNLIGGDANSNNNVDNVKLCFDGPGLDGPAPSELGVFPESAFDYLVFFEGTKNNNLISVFDITGRQVYSVLESKNFDHQSLPFGIYIVVYQKNGEIVSDKVLKGY